MEKILVLMLVILGAAWSKEEHTNHGPHVAHHKADGEHNPAFDHEAVLGSEDLEDEFAGLEPKEAERRLVELAKTHDQNKDGFIDREEMYNWMVASFLSLDREEAVEKLEEEDSDRDGSVTVDEYIDKNFAFTQKDVDQLRETVANAKGGAHEEEDKENARTLKMLDDDLKKFKGADRDGNGKLDTEEYIAFFFPQNYPHMHQFEMDLYMDDNDRDGDGKISKAEFVTDPANDEARISAEENFADLDKNGDGELSQEELKEWVVPEGDELAQEEGEHLINMADGDGDGRLSLEEIAARTTDFVGSSATDYGSILRHEEL